MTTGRINQVTIVRYCISNNHACQKAHTITGNTTNRHCKWMPARWLSWVRRLKESFNSRHAYGCIQAQKYWVIRTRHDTMTVERELGSGAAMASVCFASHRTLESKTKQPTVQAGKLIKVCARRWVRRTDSVGSSCASPNSQNEFWARVRLKGDLQCSFRCYQCSERINTNLPFLLNRPKQAFYTSRRLRFFKV